ncbi:MAG TPA: tetratricopeptide repeat protein [Thermoanaerobaculia bacterium]
MTIRRLSFMLAFALLMTSLPASATCGGGGGGGNGGVMPGLGGGGDDVPLVYRVSWKVLSQGAERPQTPLAVYWFPDSPDEARKSPLQTSRSLTQAGERCVSMAIVTTDNQALREAFKATAGSPVVVVATADGAEVGRVPASDVKAVEKTLSKALDAREEALGGILDGAEKKAASDRDGAIADYQRVWKERCLSPKLGRKASKALSKLGVKTEEAELRLLGPDGLDEPDVWGRHAGVEAMLQQGLTAELAARYPDAERLYTQAVALDPADATALRYLGELYRHQTGDWKKARATFTRLLAMPADPITRAVALHGLGKMTIHSGRYADGLALFEQSLAAFPLPITYRNLAVYWFSEKQAEKAAGFMRQALALDPDDRYNQIFAAVYLAAAGHKDEAAKIAAANHNVLEASYNLAAIWAQVGDRKKAMELLRRHFYTYERFDAVRAMEMQEARDDYMFASLHADPEFVELTRMADGHSM